MAVKNPYRPFTPDPEMMSLRPSIKGMQVNGLDETEVRRPTMVYWAPDPDDIPFGEVQKWFYSHEPQDPELMKERARRREILEAPPAKLNERRSVRAPREWTDALDLFVEQGQCERVGVTRMQPQWVFDHHETDYETVVMLGVKHDYELLKSAPDQVAGAEVTRLRECLPSPGHRARKTYDKR
jgi:epoxyqueuosine reductase